MSVTYKDELDLQALTGKGAQDMLSEKAGYNTHKHNFIYGKTQHNKTNPKTLSSMFICKYKTLNERQNKEKEGQVGLESIPTVLCCGYL